MNLQLRVVGIASMAMFLASGSNAGPMGYGEGRGNDEFIDFFGDFLYGPRVDPLWNERTDTPELRELDRRIQVVEKFLGPAGADLVELRESLALGMNRQEYELDAFFAIRDIRSYVNEFENPPQFYRGYIGGEQVKIALRWLDSRAVIGMYYFVPHNRQGVDHYALLEGHNRKKDQVYFEEYDRQTMTAEMFLKKRVGTEGVVWDGERRGSDDRRDPMLMWQR